LTTTGSSGAATFSAGTLNIPEYTLSGLGGVPTSRTITINGTTQDLSANQTWTISSNVNATNTQDYTATATQTVFTVTGGYTVGQLAVFYNGSKLASNEFTAINGTTFTLATACQANDIVQAVVSVTGGGIGGSGTTNYISKWSASGVLANSQIFDNGTNVGIGNTSPSFKLDVTGTGRLTGALTALQGIFRNSGVPAIQAIRDLNVVTAGSAGQGIEFGALNGTTPTAGASIYGTLDNPATTGFLVFQTMTGGSLTTKMTITSAGNVGIGTGTPLNLSNYTTLEVKGTNAGVVAVSSNAGTAFGRMYSTGSLLYFGTSSNHAIAFDTNDFEKMRLTTSGDLGVGAVSPLGKIHAVGINTSSSNNVIYLENSVASVLFRVRNDGAISTGTAASSPYNLTVATSANVFVDSSGFLYRATSSLKYKNNVQDYDKGLNEVMQLRPVTYESKSEIEKGATFAGLIAEEVHDLGLTEFVQYAEDGTPDALSYSNMVSLLVKAIQEQQVQIEELKQLVK
jgi:hypothetical protein